MDYNKIFLPLLWPFIKFFLFMACFAVFLGLIFGAITFGRPLKKRRGGNVLDAFADAGIAISQFLISLVISKFRSYGGKTKYNDRELIAMLRGLYPNEFEEYVARMFMALGYRTKLVGGPNDGGIDIEMNKDGLQYVVQCKKFITRKVNPHDVRDFLGAITAQNISGGGFFVTTSFFTPEAERFAKAAKGNPIQLIDAPRLIQLIRKSGIVGAPEQTVSATTVQQTERCPKCGAYLVLRTNQKDGSRFYGCSGYPKCRFTKPS